ncbi:MAG: hypothetical protein PW788_11245 [Micavibrio sp.]|nr:hypothetical protein [Micavibrio sp.]
MKDSFNQDAKPSLETLLADATMKSLARFAIRNPAIALYERFAKAVDAYVDAFRETYPSLQAYIDTREAALLPLLHAKGVDQKENVVDIDAATQARINRLNEAVYDKNKYLNRDDFAELFILQLPSMYKQLEEKIKAHAAVGPAIVAATPAPKKPDAPKA